MSLLILIISTRAIADTSINPPDLHMHSGDVASYEGVLVNPSNYKLYTGDRMKWIDFQSNMDHYVHCDPPPLVAEGTEKSFVFGAATGIALVILTLILVPAH
jgi:hypothetical protein